MGKISLICEQCGGNIVLDRSGEMGTCESCFAQFVVKQDQIIQKITKNITKHVYGYQGKDVEELLEDAYKLLNLGEYKKANAKFRRAIEVTPDSWDAWRGYAFTGGDRSNPLSVVQAYQTLFGLSETKEQQTTAFVEMLQEIPDSGLRIAFMKAFHAAPEDRRSGIFQSVSGVLGRDESEMARLGMDLCPNDWHACFAMAKFRQIRAKWCTLEGFLAWKHLPAAAQEVSDIFMKTYRLAKEESEHAKQEVAAYIAQMGQDSTYKVFAGELQKQIQKEG